MIKRLTNTSAHALGLLAGLLILPALSAQAQSYPTKPIVMVVPFAAGGPTDALARLTAEGMGKDLGQQIVVENAGGAGGTIGSARVVRAPADGYTLLFGHAGTHAAAVGLYKKLPYDPINDYEHIGEVGDAPQILVVKKTLPAKTLKEFIDYTKANQKTMNFGTAGVGSAAYLGGVMLNAMLGTDVTPVHYRGAGPAMADVMAGQLDYMVDVSTTALAQIQGGTVQPIAVLRSTRIAALPDLPATPEAGLPGVDFSVWNVVMAPKGTPKPVVDRLNQALRKTLADATVRERLKQFAIELPDEKRMTPEGTKAHMQAEIERWLPIIKATGVQLD